MRRVLITAPTVAVVTVAELKTMLGITSSADDALLEMLAAGVTEQLDPASGGWLGRALRPQTWELRLDQFPGCEIQLPYPVLTSVESVKYDDSNGDEQTLVEGTGFRVFGLNGHNVASVVPLYNGSWPTARTDKEAVRVRYVCGYAGAAMPKNLKSAIALGIREIRPAMDRDLTLSREEVPGVRTREWIVSDAAQKLIRSTMENLLSTYRVWN